MTTGTKSFTKRGLALFPKTDQPYTYSQAAKKSIPDEDGKMTLEVIFDAETAASFVKELKEFAKAAGKKVVKNWPYRDEIDRETEEPTGRVIFKFAQGGKNKDGSRKYIPHFDAKARPLPRSFRLTGGSEVIVAYRPNTYDTLGGGVNMYLDGVQVTKLVEGGDAGNPGFAAQADGFEYDSEVTDGEGTDFGNEAGNDLPTQTGDSIEF